jgi:hypothetical protein
MMNIKNTVVLLLMVSSCAPAMHAQDTRQSAIANMHTVDPSVMDPTFTHPAPLAQKLVDEALTARPEVILMAIHGGAPKYDIIASNFGRIGKLGDEDDLRCIQTGKNNLEVDASGKHFEAEVPLRDNAGTIVGALGVVFNYKSGDDKLANERIAMAISSHMAAQISSAKSLFGPAI